MKTSKEEKVKKWLLYGKVKKWLLYGKKKKKKHDHSI